MRPVVDGGGQRPDDRGSTRFGVERELTIGPVDH